MIINLSRTHHILHSIQVGERLTLLQTNTTVSNSTQAGGFWDVAFMNFSPCWFSSPFLAAEWLSGNRAQASPLVVEAWLLSLRGMPGLKCLHIISWVFISRPVGGWIERIEEIHLPLFQGRKRIMGSYYCHQVWGEVWVSAVRKLGSWGIRGSPCSVKGSQRAI